MRITDEMYAEDDKRWHTRDIVTELGYCSHGMRDRRDITNLDIRFYAYIMRKAHEMLKAQSWRPFKKRELTEEEKKYHPEWCYILDCDLPDDDEEILVSDGRYVWTDTFLNNGTECCLESGHDIDDGVAWMPMPDPYKGDV